MALERFRHFRGAYKVQPGDSTTVTPWQHPRLAQVDGYAEFARDFAGASFADGLYRFHDARTGLQALDFIAAAFPEFARRVCPFGYDWLGRQFAVDAGRVVDGQPQVLLLEPGAGEALEIPTSFDEFHESELVDHPHAALASEFFKAWVAFDGGPLPLRRDQCVGYKSPLFLGGEDIVENLERSDLEVYWSLCGQLRRQVTDIL